MTPFANATTPARFALGTALGLAACALFLLVASNVLLLGLRTTAACTGRRSPWAGPVTAPTPASTAG